MTMAFAPAVWVYAGEAYGNMQGGMDQKNAGLALSAGVVMAALDMLGLKGIMGASTALRQDGIKIIAKERRYLRRSSYKNSDRPDGKSQSFSS